MQKLVTPATLATLTFMAGCGFNKASFASTPVKVSTPQGVVTCQLYTKERTIWDEVVSAPSDMSTETAFNICKQEGIRWTNS